MTLQGLKDLLNEKGISFDEKPIQNGTQVRCTDSGEIFTVYETGRVVWGAR